MGNLANSFNIRQMHRSMALGEEIRDEAAMNPNEQDRRIGQLKAELRRLMGQDDFIKFYQTTSMNGDRLERQLCEKRDALLLVAREISSCDSVYASAGNE